MPVEHVAADTPPKKIAKILDRDACCIIDRLVSPEVMDRVRDEMKPWLEEIPCGPDDFTGRKTQRVGGLIARSQTVRELVENPAVLGTVEQTLSHASNFHVHLTQTIIPACWRLSRMHEVLCRINTSSSRQ